MPETLLMCLKREGYHLEVWLFLLAQKGLKSIWNWKSGTVYLFFLISFGASKRLQLTYMHEENYAITFVSSKPRDDEKKIE